jgi:Putative methyltransferase
MARAVRRPGSELSHRLQLVVDRLSEALDSLPSGSPNRPGSPELLSLCAGEGRDVISVLRTRPARQVRAVLVESNPVLAERAHRAAVDAGLSGVEVRCGDAGDLRSFWDLVPVDVLLLCGIFGNVEPSSVQHVVEVVPSIVSPGGYVIWTRGGSDPDRRPVIRQWFESAGMEELAFDGAPAGYGVGLNRVSMARPLQSSLDERLFSFL